MPVKAVGNKIVEVSTGKVVGRSRNEATAKRAARVRNAITKSGFKPTRRPKPKRKSVASISSVRG